MLPIQAKLTMLLALIAVPVNTVFGIVAALQLTRNEFPGKTFVMSLLDLPFSISPVVTGTHKALSDPLVRQSSVCRRYLSWSLKV